MMLLLLILVSSVSCEIVHEEVQDDDDLFLNTQKVRLSLHTTFRSILLGSSSFNLGFLWMLRRDSMDLGALKATVSCFCFNVDRFPFPPVFGEPFLEQSALVSAQGGAPGRSTTSHACSSARSAAENACVFLQVSTATSRSALATTTGRPRGVAQSALRLIYHLLVS
ncbi:hypothetical protein BHE74_00022617 [Ensete ventricosum]|nr:hypothetical protein BHE74_00022617 [Ensete ventricosum]RZS27401.1 hypothetical protein BHM03_00060861 [Ensete ventricosum]